MQFIYFTGNLTKQTSGETLWWIRLFPSFRKPHEYHLNEKISCDWAYQGGIIHFFRSCMQLKSRFRSVMFPPAMEIYFWKNYANWLGKLDLCLLKLWCISPNMFPVEKQVEFSEGFKRIRCERTPIESWSRMPCAFNSIRKTNSRLFTNGKLESSNEWNESDQVSYCDEGSIVPNASIFNFSLVICRDNALIKCTSVPNSYSSEINWLIWYYI